MATWPLTLGGMKGRIASELVRGDLETQIADAIDDALSTYQGERFWFNEPKLTTLPAFNTVIGQATYDAADLAQIGLIYDIDWVHYTQSNTTFKVIRRSPEEVHLQNQTGFIAGPPSIFTYAGASITLSPVPDAIYPITIFGHIFTPGPATDNEAGNVWMTTAEKLIRSRAKYELAVHVTRNDKMAIAMHPDQDGGPGGKPGATYMAWQELKQQTNKLTSLGRIQAMQF